MTTVDSPSQPFTIEELWAEAGFKPNDNQREAILHTSGPLYLPAGPGSGKTRVLLWRALNLLVFRGIKPEEIFLSTFTEKAAHQLKEGLRSLLGKVTNRTGQPFDLSAMYVGTVHSLCQRLITDRRFYPNRERGKAPVLLDELAQYFYLYKTRMWSQLVEAVELGDEANAILNSLFDSNSSSKHVAVSNAISLFNRLSEECIDPAVAIHQTSDDILQRALEMYGLYKASLQPDDAPHRTDFSLLQRKALEVIDAWEGARRNFKHVIIDEYQDTNAIQESIFFRLAEGHKNICVVGDDDQALYRFRGATVENFVQFPARCLDKLKLKPATIPLATNYRSRKKIVDFYKHFMSTCDWSNPSDPTQHYRVTDKEITPFSEDNGPSVIASDAAKPEIACAEIAALVRRLIDEKKVQNPNQIAFLFPSLKYNGLVNTHVRRMKEALEAQGLKVYAPRAGRFLEVDEAIDVFGLYLHIFGKPTRGNFPGHDYDQFHAWLDRAYERGHQLIQSDPQLRDFVADRKQDIATALSDYAALHRGVSQHRWDPKAPYNIDTMKRPLYSAPGLSERAKRSISSSYFERIVKGRIAEGRPFALEYIIKRATALDWEAMDLFYRLCGFSHFKAMFDLAENGSGGGDEGPIANLALISQYLARFNDEYITIITANYLDGGIFQRLFFGSYLFALFRRSESEFEDAEDPFPKGRIPFLTIHQAKGLEFPVVVLGNPRKDDRGPQTVETIVRPFIDREGEPLDRMSKFDIMRLFYVALSRAQNLLIVAHFKGQGIRIHPAFQTMLDTRFPRIQKFDLDSLPHALLEDQSLPKNYSYTGDYLQYNRCPRQYMAYRRYGFIPSHSQTMMFGTLVHRTIDDVHQYLIARRSQS